MSSPASPTAGGSHSWFPPSSRSRCACGRTAGRTAGPAAATAGALALGAAASTAALVFVATNGSPSGTQVRRLVSYVWQFYLPRLGFMSPPLGGQDYGIREVMTERLYGAFAQLEVHFPSWFYDALWAAMGVVAVGAFAALLVHRRAVAARWDVAVVLAGAVLGLLGLLHTVAYRSLLNNAADPIIAGRYLLPLAALFGIAVALAVSLIPRRWGAVAGGAVVATLALVQVAALGVTLERFYA